MLSYFARTIGSKTIEINQNEPKVKDVLDELGNRFPEFSDIFHDSNPDVSLILDGKSLYLPKGLEEKIKDELIIGPVVAGG